MLQSMVQDYIMCENDLDAVQFTVGIKYVILYG